MSSEKLFCGVNNRKPLPAWEQRLVLFLQTPSARWPLQWMSGKDGVVCLRCGEDVGVFIPKRGAPACHRCSPEVDRVIASVPNHNDWSMRERVDLVRES